MQSHHPRRQQGKKVCQAAAKNLIDALLTWEDIEDVEINPGDALNLAAYARHLEGEVAEYKLKEKSPSEVASAAETLRAVTASGIQKQMTVRCFSPLSLSFRTYLG